MQLIPVIEDIRLESSTFYFENYSQGLIEGTNANNFHRTGNYLTVSNNGEYSIENRSILCVR